MLRAPGEALAGRLAAASTRHPGWVAGICALLAAGALAASGGGRSEVGYAAYFGPESPELRGLEAFLDEFETGSALLIVFGCRESPRCERVDEPWALDFLARLHEAAEALPNARRVSSAWTVPVVLGPLDARPLAAPGGGRFVLAPDWRARFAAGLAQPSFAGVVVAPDARAAGVVVELTSIESEALRATVRGALALLPRFERELGAELHLAGDPVWTVVSADSLDRDSALLTALMFVAMAGLLWLLFRDPWLTALPLLAVAVVSVLVEGAAQAAGLPRTSLLAALPPLLVAIAIAGSIHLLAAVARAPGAAPGQVLVSAARDVGEGCFWSAFTTAAGFASFLTSDLASFRHFGALAGAGVLLAFVVTFTLLPALLCLRLRRGPLRVRHHRSPLAREVLAALCETVTRHPRFVVVASLVAFGVLGSGMVRLRYASDFGFGEDSYVVRSLRAIEANFRKPMTTDVVVTLPPGAHVWEPPALALLARIEAIFAAEPSTGAAWSFLDLLEEAHRLDRGAPPASFAALVEAAPRQMALVAASERMRWLWNENGRGGRERAHVSVDRAWLDDAAQGPYVARVGRALEALAREPAAAGAEIELTGGLLLADRFVGQLRDTQRTSFASAFLVVAATLLVLLRSPPRLVGWAIAVNVVPVLALLGLMGWAGIGVDPANTMVGAILLGLGVDDTIHVSLRVRDARRRGRSMAEAVSEVFDTVGEAVLATSLCLAVGFSVLLCSQWGGLVSFGLVASLGVALLLAGDVLLLPAALLGGAARGWRP
ncbi:MAG: MMPL family transporter [Deltaproteobacteria bacterium]|nr:MMPL family transporter [Deltaproteobacteria bacterium]